MYPERDVRGSATEPGRARRTDAIQNRQRIIDTARSMLSEASDQEQVTMQAVAKRARVGQGTLYRHFSNREDLVLAVYETDVERLVASAASLAGACPPREALQRWFTELAAYGRLKRGISQIVLSAVTREDIATTWRPRVLDAVQKLIDADHDHHEVRDDIDAGDLWNLLAFLWQTPISPERAERLIAVVIDGLCTTPEGEPGSASRRP